MAENADKKGIIKKHKNKIIMAVVVLILGVAIGLFVDNFLSESTTTKIGFEDIAELDTQSANCAIIDVMRDSRKIFGKAVPFTQTEYIYSYNVVVKAGLNFKEIVWKEKGKRIEIKMPSIHVTDSYIDEKSGKVYREEESIFSPVTFKENMQAKTKLVKRGVDDAIANGLYRNAKKNAEVILKSFFRQHAEYKEHKIVFKWEKDKKI